MASDNITGPGAEQPERQRKLEAQAAPPRSDETGTRERISQQARAGAEDIRRTAREGAHQAAEGIRGYSEDQKNRAAASVDHVASALESAANELSEKQEVQAAQWVREAAGGAEKIASFMHDRSLRDMLGSIEDFARREPVAFVGGATLAGFLAIRFLKSAPPREGDERTDSSSHHADGPASRPPGSPAGAPGMAAGTATVPHRSR